MTALYRLAFRLLRWHAEQIDVALFWLWLRCTQEPDECEALREPPQEPANVVHLPRRGLH